MEAKSYDEIRAEMVALFPAGRIEIGASGPDTRGFDGSGWKNMADAATGTLRPFTRGATRSTARRVASVRLMKDGRHLYSTEYRYPVEVASLGEHSNHWRPVQRNGSRSFQPHVADCIAALINDARDCDQTFSQWCADLGYDDDSIKARNAYDACQRCRDALLTIMDRATFDKLNDLASEL